MSESIYESAPYPHTIRNDPHKYLKWKHVSPEVKKRMRDHIHLWFQDQTNQLQVSKANYPSIDIPGFLEYVEKKFFGSSIVVVYSHAILEYLKDISFRHQFMLTYNDRYWSINIIYNMADNTNINTNTNTNINTNINANIIT